MISKPHRNMNCVCSRVCGTYWREEKCIQDLVQKSEEKRPTWKKWLRWRIILRRNLSNKMGGVEWINLARDRYKKKAVLSAGNLLLAEKTLDSENDLCSMELFI
jgi:hypothetical protein